MDLITLLKDYGWVAVVVGWILPKMWSFVTDRWFPQKVKEREEMERGREMALQAEREARAQLIKAQIDRENRESERRMELDKRTVTAIEQMSLAIIAGNERIAALIASHTQHANFTFGAHIELKDRLDDIQESIVYRQKVDDLEKDLKDTKERIKAVPPGDSKPV